MNSLFLPLVNWGLGTILIGVFALVCIILIAIIYNLSRGTNNVKGNNYQERDNDKENGMVL